METRVGVSKKDGMSEQVCVQRQHRFGVRRAALVLAAVTAAVAALAAPLDAKRLYDRVEERIAWSLCRVSPDDPTPQSPHLVARQRESASLYRQAIVDLSSRDHGRRRQGVDLLWMAAARNCHFADALAEAHSAWERSAGPYSPPADSRQRMLLREVSYDLDTLLAEMPDEIDGTDYYERLRAIYNAIPPSARGVFMVPRLNSTRTGPVVDSIHLAAGAFADADIRVNITLAAYERDGIGGSRYTRTRTAGQDPARTHPIRIEVSRGQLNDRTGPLDRHVYRSAFGFPVFLEQLVDNIRAGNISDSYFHYRWVLHEDGGWRREPL